MSVEARFWVWAWVAVVVFGFGVAWHVRDLVISGALFACWAMFAWEKASGNEGRS